MLGTCLFFACLISVLHMTTADPLKWLALGDSITFGCGSGVVPPTSVFFCNADAGGYRVPTAFALAQAGLNITTVGEVTAGPVYVPADWTRHDGWPGARIDQVEAKNWTQYVPDVVTVHLGTNDCGQNATAEMAIQRMQSLLQKIFTLLPKVQVYLCSIIALPESSRVCADGLNAQLPDVVAQWKRKGKDAIYVPMHELTVGVCGNDATSIPGLCLVDGTHPTPMGYLRMASVLADAMITRLVNKTWDTSSLPSSLRSTSLPSEHRLVV